MGRGLLMLLVSVYVCAAFNPAWATGNQDELIKKIETLEQQLKELKELQKTSGEKKTDCMKAFGRDKFCTCVAEKLPRAVNFEQYVHTVITAKETLGYEGMTPEQRKVADQTMATRDICAEKEKGGFLW